MTKAIVERAGNDLLQADEYLARGRDQDDAGTASNVTLHPVINQQD
jgi:hypothetical protein